MNVDDERKIYDLYTSTSKKVKYWWGSNPQMKKKNVENFWALLAVSIL